MSASLPSPTLPFRSAPAHAAAGQVQVLTGAGTLVASLLVLALLSQEAALAYGHVMYRAVEAPPDVVYRGLILLVPLLAFLLMLFCKPPTMAQPRGFGLLLTMFILSTAMAVLMSFSMCLMTKYFFGDALRFLAPWLTLFLSYQAFRLIRYEVSLKRLIGWYDLLALIALVDAFQTVGFGLVYFGHHISNWFYIFLIGWVILSDRHSELTTNFVLGTVLLATVASHKRTNFVLFLLAFALSLGLRIVRGGQVLRLCFTLGGMVLIGGVAQIVVANATGQESLIEIIVAMYENINEIVVEGEHDNSYEYRVNETRNIEAHFREQQLMSVFGVGFGGEIPMLFDAGPESATPVGNMHHTHKGYWLYLLRNGFFGLALLALFAWLSTIGLLTIRSAAPLITSACAVYAVTRIVASFGGNLMMEDLDLPLVVGLGFAFVDLGASAPAGGHQPSL